MKKFEYLEFVSLFKNFGSIITKMYLFFLIPLSFVYLIALQAVLFVKCIIVCLFAHIPSSENEHIAMRVTALILFSFVQTFNFIILGSLDVCIFILGFFYDLTNKIMTFGRSDAFFVNM